MDTPPPPPLLSVPSSQMMSRTRSNGSLASCSPLTSSMVTPAVTMGLTHGDIAELHEGFRLLAGNNVVQQIGIKDLKDVLVSVGFPATEDMSDLFRVANQQCIADHLTFHEFLLLMTKQVDEKMQEELKAAFRHYDKEGKGVVSVAQFCEMLASMGDKSSPDEVSELMMFADPDGTGKIEYARLIQNLADRLKR